MGKSLQVEKDGVHMAFAGGTGILCFIDLVAHLIFKNLGLNERMGIKANDCVGNGFKLKLFVSFQSRKDAIGLELLEKFHDFCKAQGHKNFELYVRLSQEKLNPARWDAAFISQQLPESSDHQIKKIWVCGPPVMAETFDRTFSQFEAANPNRFKKGTYEIL